MSVALLLLGVNGQRCPVLSCDNPDGIMSDLGACYWAEPHPNGTIKTIYLYDSCSRDDYYNPYSCGITPGKFVWLNTDLQFKNLTATTPTIFDSQYYNKVFLASCANKNDVILTRMNSGRTCTDNSQCLTRNCGGFCTGQSVDSECTGHDDCDVNLACIAQPVWPYATTCQPRRDVMDACDTSYDCKMRNFCWRLGAGMPKVCLERFTAPFGTQFFWDSVNYPTVNKTSLMHHAQYCASGFVVRVSTNVAECQNISTIAIRGNALQSPYNCTPGVDKCQYLMANNSMAFNLTCDCAMTTDPNTGLDLGYCPLPGQDVMQSYISAIQQVWYSDGCHTLDRDNYYAQVDCGAGSWNTVIATALDLKMQVDHWAVTQDPDMFQCLVSTLPTSSYNAYV